MMRCLLLFGSRTDFATPADLRSRRFATVVTSLLTIGLAALIGLASPTACAQDEAALDDEEVVEAGGESEPLKTKDGLKMACRYYPGPEDKETIPVVLLHGWKGQGSDYDALAQFLQSDEGGAHSVIVPDLRGHGGSTELKPEGSEDSKKINADRMNKQTFQEMLRFDLEAVKKFLMEKHHQGALNIDSLTVVGSEMGSVLALHWTARDWSWEPLAGIKQGQDVKAVVLLSPPASFKGVTPALALKQTDVRDSVSLMLLYGRDDAKATSSATKLHNVLKRNRQQEFDSNEEKREKQDLFRVGLETSLQGSDLLMEEEELPTSKYISQFIEGRVRNHMEDDFPWKARRRAN